MLILLHKHYLPFKDFEPQRIINKMMFSSKVILFLSAIIACLISSSSGSSESKESEQGTKIKILKEDMKIFLWKVKDLDPDLKLPSEYEKIDKIRNYSIRRGFASVESDGKLVNRFRDRYDKFVKYSVNAIDGFLKQFKTILEQSPFRNIGFKATRQQLCEYYEKEFIKKMIIKGSGAEDPKIKKDYDELKDKLQQLYTTLVNMEDRFPPPPPPQSKEKKHKKGSQSSSSHSSEGKHETFEDSGGEVQDESAPQEFHEPSQEESGSK